MEDPADAEDFSELDDPEAYFEIETGTANPLVEDTDGDGLTDLEERQLGTNPSAGDTTSDGISDSRAVIVVAVPIYRYDRTPEDSQGSTSEPSLIRFARTPSCGQPGTDVQQPL